MRTALIIGAGAVAAYLFLFRQPATVVGGGGGAAAGAGFAGSFGGAATTMPPASIPTAGVNLTSLSGINALSNAGCTAIASSKGVPSSLGATGCQLYSLVTPIGLANLGLKQVEKIPVVGGAVKAAGGAISGAAKSVYHDITSIF